MAESIEDNRSIVHQLRSRWNPLKEGPASATEHQPICIRLHRCFSWMDRVEKLQETELHSDDTSLIFSWIALNSLYGRWDGKRNEPAADIPSLQEFTKRMFEHDANDLLEQLLLEHKPLVEKITGNEYLNRRFWQYLDDRSARKAQGHVHKVRECYREGRFRQVLDDTLTHIYLARCQIIHGAATHEGKLNRQPIRWSATFLGHVLPAFASIIIESAWQDDCWDDLCYPPQH